jgi:ABC-type nitrate/sulfonate/bicarbonate transport system substrate-binding protein
MTASGLTRRTLLHRASLAVGGVALYGVAGCGDPETGESGPGGSYEGEQAVTHLDEIIASAPFKIAHAKGYFEKAGLDVKSVSFPGGADVVRAIQTSMPIGMGATVATLVAFQKGFDDLRIVAGAFNAPEVVFIAPADSEVKAAGDLRGSKVGVSEPSSVSTYFANVISKEKAGGDLKIVSVGGPSDAWTSAEQGVVDVAWSSPPFSTQLIESGDARLVIDTADLAPRWTDTAMISRQSFLEENEEVVRNWLGALGDAYTLIREDPEAAGAAWGKTIDIEPEVTTKALRDYADAFSLKIDRAGIDANVEAARTMGQLTGDVALDELLVPGLVGSDAQ